MSHLIRVFLYTVIGFGTFQACVFILRDHRLLPRDWLPWIWAAAGIAVVLIAVLSIMPVRLRQRNLERHGIEAVARVVSVAQTGLYLNELPQVQLQLVYSVGSRLRLATTTSVVDYLDISKLEPGLHLRIKYAPRYPSSVKIMGTASPDDAPELARAGADIDADAATERPTILGGAFTAFVLGQFVVIGAVYAVSAYFAPGRMVAFLPFGEGEQQRLLVVHKIGRSWFSDLQFSMFESNTGALLNETRMSEGLGGSRSPAIVGYSQKSLWLVDATRGLQSRDVQLRIAHDHEALTRGHKALQWSRYEPAQFRFDPDEHVMYMKGTDGIWYRLQPKSKPQASDSSPKGNWRRYGCPDLRLGARAIRRTRNGTGRMAIGVFDVSASARKKSAYGKLLRSTEQFLNPFVLKDRRCDADRSQQPLLAGDARDFFIVHSESLDIGEDGERTTLISRLNLKGESRWTTKLPVHAGSLTTTAHLVGEALAFPPVGGRILLVDIRTGEIK